MKQVKVWDLPVRLSHAAFPVLVLGAFLTSEEDARLPLHMRLGAVLLGVVLFRVAWGFVGGEHARFRDFLRPPREVLAAARSLLRGHPSPGLGHNPVGGVMVVVLLATLLATGLTGALLALGPEWRGLLALSPFALRTVKSLHEALAEALPVLVALHVAGVLLSSWLERQNLPWAMVTGLKRAAAEPTVARAPGLPRPLALAVAALTGCAAAVPLALLLPARAAQAEEPLLAPYARAAQAEDTAFTGFDAARGQAFFLALRATPQGPTSCATCHTEDPTQPGQTPVGKRLSPLAPSANPERLRDARTVEKWLGRNCKQVLGRPCTAREAGDVLTFLSSR